MDNEKIEAAFNAAFAEYESLPNHLSVDRTTAQYFFFSGAQFGMDNFWALYNNHFPQDDVAGHPV